MRIEDDNYVGKKSNKILKEIEILKEENINLKQIQLKFEERIWELEKKVESTDKYISKLIDMSSKNDTVKIYKSISSTKIPDFIFDNYGKYIVLYTQARGYEYNIGYLKHIKKLASFSEPIYFVGGQYEITKDYTRSIYLPMTESQMLKYVPIMKKIISKFQVWNGEYKYLLFIIESGNVGSAFGDGAEIDKAIFSDLLSCGVKEITKHII